jgi:methylenetetrahydrofolate dehydrogenase (NADP+)/methenyltetrahydrofolate cyclohydrolase
VEKNKHMAAARLIDGRVIADALQQRVGAAAARLREEHNVIPGLATILVGNDPSQPDLRG